MNERAAAFERLSLRSPQGETVLLFAGGSGKADAPPPELVHLLAGKTTFVLSTPEVRRLHGGRIEALTAPAGRRIELEAPDGEPAKSLEVAGRLWQEMLAAGGKRDSVLVAVGGGSATDLGGFLAGTFLRGIPVVQVPTTLLAMVDAAIGGKTAIDLPQGKNTVGVFHHPALFLADTEFLATLPTDELRSGLVEALKMAAMLDPALFERIDRDLPALLAGESEALLPVVVGAAAAKCRVVEEDPDERGLRKVLNFGHTLGHAIEGLLGYAGLRHGEAIAYGILFVLGLQRRLPAAPNAAIDSDFFDRLVALLRRMELPPLPLGGESAAGLIGFMRRDKKASEQGLTWVMPTRLGEFVFRSDIGWDTVAGALADYLKDPWGFAGDVVPSPVSTGESGPRMDE